MTADTKNLYLGALLDREEYMRMSIDLIPAPIIQQYELEKKVHKGFVYMKICRGMYGLSQAGILANKLLRK